MINALFKGFVMADDRLLHTCSCVRLLPYDLEVFVQFKLRIMGDR